MNLRDSLLSALHDLPGTREFHIHVLVTAPAKNNSLYPYALPRPRLYAQDILVLLSEQANPDAPRILVTAIEAGVYHAPATDTAIFYVSKVDSTGQGISPSPTATLVRALVRWYCDPATRPVSSRHLWVHLFARAQGQYLFPNSADHESKKPLSDVKLCAWWRRVLGTVAADVQAGMGGGADAGKVRMYYVLPGYNEMEAEQALRLPATPPDAAEPRWQYGHPYTQTDIPLPCPPPEGTPNLGHFIPSFDDDPKNRFMDELALTDSVASPRKRARTGSAREAREARESDGPVPPKEKDAPPRPKGELSKVAPDEFWERMSFRQECVAGAVTGFFTVGVSAPQAPAVRPPPLEPQAGQVPRAMNKRVLTTLLTGTEFSTAERARQATEIIESAVRGLCEGLAVPAAKPPSSVGGSLALPRTPPRRSAALPSVDDASPNPFDEPEATLETYRAHIYGVLTVSNAPLPPKVVPGGAAADGAGAGAPKVNVLAVRKKKKRSEPPT
ncbi:hypothetical protein FA95DRAFT_1564285 [Auriscalpium vulgare]|uniref:Uncharacterized protein n=1 Tax=Auriscalpium vulgare TaxID=40419 RepID=A0ACB8RF29_9AGAM|nr:hypothetical protein FA95DRAFT_1564285 [Auriscalpium vulgare]